MVNALKIIVCILNILNALTFSLLGILTDKITKINVIALFLAALFYANALIMIYGG